MQLFDYVGQLSTGETFEGTLEADSPRRAETLLATMGVRVSSLRPARRRAFVAPLSVEDFTFLNERLAALSDAGLPLPEGLRRLAADSASRRMKRLLIELAADLERGMPLDQALALHRARFPTDYATVVRAGMRSGDLSATLHALTTSLRMRSDARRAVLELAIYPLATLAFALLILRFLFLAVVPEVLSIVRETEDLGGVYLPAEARPLAALAAAWPTIQWIAVSAVGVAALMLIVAHIPGMRGFREGLLLSIPGVRGVYWSGVLARFSHTSAVASLSGLPLTELISCGAEAAGSPSLLRAAARLNANLDRGDALAEAAENEPLIPSLWVCVVRSAGARGELPAALTELARCYESQARQRTAQLRFVLGPLLMFLLAAGVGSVLVSIVLVFSAIIRALGGL